MEDDPLKVLSWRYTKARIHIESDSAFVNDIILDRDSSEYPDPYIRNLEDGTLLSNYLTRVITAIRSYTPENDEEEAIIADFFNREQERVNEQLGIINTPHPTKCEIAKETVDTLENNKLKTGYVFSQRDIPWETYETLYNDLSIRDLRILAAHFKTKTNMKGREKEGKNTRIVNSIRYVRGDPTVSLENIIAFVPIEQVKEDMAIEIDGEQIELTEGVPFEVIKDNLTKTLRKFPTLETALALANIGKITNYHNPRISNGLYNTRETNISEAIPKTGDTERNVVAHEFFHSLQDVTATRDLHAQGNAVEFESEPDSWDPIVYPDATRHTETQREVKHLWFKFRNGGMPKLCDYQTKNVDEMYAVAFEALVENPEVLQEQQPEVYRHFNYLLN